MTDLTPLNQPRETLQGDRLCAQCLHPLVGRTIEREPQTGLLFVRCGECGAASALFEYPTATPWINRMKAVVASTLVFVILGLAIVIAASAGGFTAGAASEASEASGDALAAAHPLLQTTEKGTAVGRWGDADILWLATPEGQAAIAASRWNLPSFLYLGLLGGLGSLIAAPFMLFLAACVSRHRPLRRALLAMVPSLVGTSCALAIVNANALLSWRPSATWQSVATREHLSFFLWVMWIWFNGLAAVIALVGPALVAGVARLILPPRDRRLVAWLWEWRGKTVPRD